MSAFLPPQPPPLAYLAAIALYGVLNSANSRFA